LCRAETLGAKDNSLENGLIQILTGITLVNRKKIELDITLIKKMVYSSCLMTILLLNSEL
jgi:hypothetical protein